MFNIYSRKTKKIISAVIIIFLIIAWCFPWHLVCRLPQEQAVWLAAMCSMFRSIMVAYFPADDNCGKVLRSRGYEKMVSKAMLLLGTVFCAFSLLTVNVEAKGDDTLKKGVYAEEISLAGMTEEEAAEAIGAYVDSLKEAEITLLAAGDNEVTVTAGELGLSWKNTDIIEEAKELGMHGNVVQRYKELKDLENENKVYPIELGFDVTAINNVLVEKCSVFDREAIDYTLTRENGAFKITDGQTGYRLDVETSIDEVYDYMTNKWARGNETIALTVEEEQPRGNEEELSLVKDVLGTYTTTYKSSNSNRSGNIANGCRLIDGTTLYPGDEFSTYQTVSPFSEKNGYYMAGSYLNGKVVDSLGGGICQVSTTLYNAVLLSELDVTERYNHSMIVSYVSPSADAAIAESSGKDFKFVNNTEHPVYIEGHTEDKKITFTIYGVETRPANRTVEYESEILETINPTSDALYPDAAYPLGYISVTGAHIGYKARLWKVVKEDGVQVSREVVNSSSYKMVPRSAVVGVSTADANAYNEIMAACGTGSIDHVKNVIAILNAQQAAAAAAPAAPTE